MSIEEIQVPDIGDFKDVDAIGCVNAWLWVSKEDKAMRDEPENDDE
jgi:hypothetical protein